MGLINYLSEKWMYIDVFLILDTSIFIHFYNNPGRREYNIIIIGNHVHIHSGVFSGCAMANFWYFFYHVMIS